MNKLTVGVFNDSFPPTVDGVANVTVNYARVIQQDFGTAFVATPYYPNVKDDYPFEVMRYPSAYIKNEYGYRTGYPFDPLVIREIGERKPDIIHAHCPIISTILARAVRGAIGVPIVFTYHTKFDQDIANLLPAEAVQKTATKLLVANISACDEVWVVSHGAGDNLRSLGYTGDYIVMENGTDFKRGRASDGAVAALRKQYDIQPDETVFLFVGRMMWYKGVKLSLDGLRYARDFGKKFRFILVGGGADEEEIKSYIRQIGMDDRCVMTGPIGDREKLREYFTLADVFLFPSTFDTNGIVVREAAACSCPSVLIKGSCAAEGVTDGETGIIIGETADELCKAVMNACENREAVKRIGEKACSDIYISWEDAVAKAVDRYQVVLENNKKRFEDEVTLKELWDEAYLKALNGLNLTFDRIAGITDNAKTQKNLADVKRFRAVRKAVLKGKRKK